MEEVGDKFELKLGELDCKFILSCRREGCDKLNPGGFGDKFVLNIGGVGDKLLLNPSGVGDKLLLNPSGVGDKLLLNPGDIGDKFKLTSRSVGDKFESDELGEYIFLGEET